MNTTLFYSKLLALSLFFSFFSLSCRPEPEPEPEIIKGCTDSSADNFNPAAQEDNGSCTYQNKYVGLYDMAIQCGLLTNSFSEATLNIKASSNKQLLDIELNAVNFKFNFFARVTKDTAYVDTTYTNFVINPKDLIIQADSAAIRTNFTLKSKMVLRNNNRAIKGPLNIIINNIDPIKVQTIDLPPNQTFKDDCDIDAIKR